MKTAIFLMLVVLVPGVIRAQQKSPEAPPQPKIEINLASKAELETLPGIGPERADWIIETRRKNGTFRCIEELRAMPRLSDRQFDALRLLTFVTDPDPRCRNEAGRSEQ